MCVSASLQHCFVPKLNSVTWPWGGFPHLTKHLSCTPHLHRRNLKTSSSSILTLQFFQTRDFVLSLKSSYLNCSNQIKKDTVGIQIMLICLNYPGPTRGKEIWNLFKFLAVLPNSPNTPLSGRLTAWAVQQLSPAWPPRPVEEIFHPAVYLFPHFSLSFQTL